MNVIHARFIGENLSMGYLTGAVYRLELIERDGKYPVEIRRMEDGTGYCPYSSFYKFLQNWEEVSLIIESEKLWGGGDKHEKFIK